VTSAARTRRKEKSKTKRHLSERGGVLVNYPAKSMLCITLRGPE
jgi:hypothetical protein